MPDERFPLVDEEGRVVGSALRSEVHGNPSLLHPVVHCIVTDPCGRILLQLRSMDKDIQPGKWDTSVGGHVGWGEAVEDALRRELREEIGLEQVTPRFLYRYVMCSNVERELVYTYACVSAGPFQAQASEIDALRFWHPAEVAAALGSGVFTPNFEDEWRRFQRFAGAEG